jgi:MFS transporter, SP family, solute carrier family 2 (myo-inositol transporter), member 13
LIISLASIGAAIGALFAGTISDKIGRKMIIVIADVLFTIGALIQALAPTIAVLMVGRIIIGLGVGVASVIAPLYISEISPTELRGQLVAINIFTIVFGQLIAASIAFALGEQWRIMLGLAAIPSIIQFFGMFFMPESPRWLGKEEKWDKARGVLARIFTESALDDKFEDLKNEVETLKTETAMSECERLKDLLTVYKKCLTIGCGLQAW